MACCVVDPTQGDHVSLKISRSDLALIAASTSPAHRQLDKGGLKAMLDRKLQYEHGKHDIEAQYPQVDLQGYHEDGSQRVRFCTWRVLPVCIVATTVFSMGGIMVATLGYRQAIPKKGLTIVSIILSCLFFFFLLGTAYLWNEKNGHELVGKIRDDHALLANLGKVFRSVYVCLGFPEPKTTHYIVLEPRMGHLRRTGDQEQLSIHHPEPGDGRTPSRSRRTSTVDDRDQVVEELELEGRTLYRNQRPAPGGRQRHESISGGGLPPQPPPPVRTGRGRMNDRREPPPELHRVQWGRLQRRDYSTSYGNCYLAEIPGKPGQPATIEIPVGKALESHAKRRPATTKQYPPGSGLFTPDSTNTEAEATSPSAPKGKRRNIEHAAREPAKNEHGCVPGREVSSAEAHDTNPDTGCPAGRKLRTRKLHKDSSLRIHHKSPLTVKTRRVPNTARQGRSTPDSRLHIALIPVPVRSSSPSFNETHDHLPTRSVSPVFSPRLDANDSGSGYSTDIEDVPACTAAASVVSGLSDTQESPRKRG